MERARILLSHASRSWRPAAVGAGLCGALVAAVITGSQLVGSAQGAPGTGSGTTQTSTHADSGTLGPWQQSGHSAAPAATMRQVAADPRGILLVGDSTGTRSRTAITAALTGHPLSWDLWNGRPTHGSVDAVVAMVPLQQVPRTVLVLSGSNDVFEPEAFGPQVERLMEHVGADRQVFWVAPDVERPASLAADRDNSRRMRSALTAAAGAHPNLHVIAWPDALAAKTQEQRAALVVDGVHPSPAGANALAQLIATALR